MVRLRPDGWTGARQVLFVLLPVLVGAGVLLSTADRTSIGASRLETTQGSVLAPGSDDVGDPSNIAAFAPATPDAVAPAPPSGTETPVGTGPASRPVALSVPDAGSPSSPGMASTTGTEPAGSSSPGVAAMPTVGGGRASTTAPPAPTTATTSTTSAPAAEVTITTAAPAPVVTGRARDTSAEAEVVPLTNADRSGAGIGSLSRSACLDSIASGYAEQLARSGVLVHNPAAGPAVQGCRPNATWGDNVGTSAPCDTALLEREWMASPTHRRNILTGAFTLIGVGAWTDAQGGCWVQVLFSN